MHSNLPSVKFPLHEWLFNEAIARMNIFHERNLNNVQCLLLNCNNNTVEKLSFSTFLLINCVYGLTHIMIVLKTKYLAQGKIGLQTIVCSYLPSCIELDSIPSLQFTFSSIDTVNHRECTVITQKNKKRRPAHFILHKNN